MLKRYVHTYSKSLSSSVVYAGFWEGVTDTAVISEVVGEGVGGWWHGGWQVNNTHPRDILSPNHVYN